MSHLLLASDAPVDSASSVTNRASDSLLPSEKFASDSSSVVLVRISDSERDSNWCASRPKCGSCFFRTNRAVVLSLVLAGILAIVVLLAVAVMNNRSSDDNTDDLQ